MTEQHQGQTEPSHPVRQVTREMAERHEEKDKEAGEPGQQNEDATDEGMPEAPATGEEAPIGSGGAPVPGGTGMPGDEGEPGTGDQNAQQQHTPTV